MCIQEVKFVLNPALPLCYFYGNPVRLELGEFLVMSPLGFNPSLAHFHGHLGAASKPLPDEILPELVLKVIVVPVVKNSSYDSSVSISLSFLSVRGLF